MLKTIRMLSASQQLCYRIENLEIKFNVSSVLFTKYSVIFDNIYKYSSFNSISVLIGFKSELGEMGVGDEHVQTSTRFNLRKKDSFDLNDLFNFGWLLFIFIKG